MNEPKCNECGVDLNENCTTTKLPDCMLFLNNGKEVHRVL